MALAALTLLVFGLIGAACFVVAALTAGSLVVGGKGNVREFALAGVGESVHIQKPSINAQD